MDLSLTERQQLLKTTAAEFVEKEAPSHVITELSRKGVGNVPDLWRKASALGWTGMMTPSEYGGADTGYTDSAVIFEELGRGPVVGPLLSRSSGPVGAPGGRQRRPKTATAPRLGRRPTHCYPRHLRPGAPLRRGYGADGRHSQQRRLCAQRREALCARRERRRRADLRRPHRPGSRSRPRCHPAPAGQGRARRDLPPA